MARKAGKAVTLTLAPYVYDQLCKLEEKQGIRKSAIVTLALERYARAEEKVVDGKKGGSNDN